MNIQNKYEKKKNLPQNQTQAKSSSFKKYKMERTKTIEELPKQIGNANVEVKPENLSFQ